jgi:predicted MPP superfamily phosphohydrolase
MACALSGVVAIAQWVLRQVIDRTPAAVRSQRAVVVHHGARNGPLLTRIPGNQIQELELSERGLEISRLDPALDGLSIVHLTDLHVTGKIGRGYFEEVVRQSVAVAPDLIAVTGDILDNIACLDWIPETIGKLRARYGVYFVLGNHDMWTGAEQIRHCLTECGLTDVGGRWVEIEIRGRRVILAGNESPWWPPADLGRAPQRRGKGPLRIALCHSPDQFRWARVNDIDLALAGHTHGGQFRIPFIGPFVAPSRHGVRYASGVFHAAPTVMHVGRGVSGKLPLRICCRPEVAKLTLYAATDPANQETAAPPRRKRKIRVT